MTGAGLKWLIFEGAIPLLGSAALFLLWGLCRKVTNNKSQRVYAWSHAVDPIGWLYGAAVVAFGAGMKSAGRDGVTIITVFCFIAAGVCMLVLISALTERAEDAQWAPTSLLKWVAVILVAVILFAGMQVTQTLAEEMKNDNSSKGPVPQAGSANH